MRIVHVASGREWRGGQNQVWLLARTLQERGQEAPDRSDAGLDQVVVTGGGSELERRLRASGVPVRAATWRSGTDPRALWATIDEARRGPCLLHAHDGHAITLAGVAAALCRRPYVATRRVDFHLKRPLFWRRAARIIAVSAAVRDIMIQDGIPAGRVRVVHSGIDVEAARAHRDVEVRRRLDLPADAFVVINVAALVPHKDQATLIEAAARLAAPQPRLRWLILGEGELRGDLERRIAARGLNGRVHLLGHQADPTSWIAASDLMVLSSKEEGLGTTLLDAMANGVPVVATRAGGIPEVLGDDGGLLVPVGDPAALAKGVARVLSDADLRRRLAAQGRARAERFSHRRMANQILAIYNEVLTTVQGDTTP